MTKPERPRPRFPLQLEGLVPGSGSKPAPLLRPQAPLHQAAADSVRAVRPSGLGLDSGDVRHRMVDRLQATGLRHELVVAAMKQVPRHLFVDTALATQAYEDTSLPIGLGQTISKPSVVAHMVELLMAGARARVRQSLGPTLEIGTGCGYQAAVLAQLSRQVITVERLKPLHEKARALLVPLRLTHIRLVYGDGMRGHAPNAPYDSIISAAGGDALPDAWLEQLAIGGRLVAPVHDAAGRQQVLVVVDRTESGFVRSTHETVNFVPLKSGMD